MTQKIIFGIGVIVGLVLFKKTNPILLKLILIGLAVCYVLGLLNHQITSTIGFVGFGILSLTFGIYSANKKMWLNMIIGFSASITIIHSIMNWPFYGIMQFAMITPIICYLIICLNWKKYINEFSISTILTFYMTTLFVDFISKWI